MAIANAIRHWRMGSVADGYERGLVGMALKGANVCGAPFRNGRVATSDARFTITLRV